MQCILNITAHIHICGLLNVKIPPDLPIFGNWRTRDVKKKTSTNRFCETLFSLGCTVTSNSSSNFYRPQSNRTSLERSGHGESTRCQQQRWKSWRHWRHVSTKEGRSLSQLCTVVYWPSLSRPLTEVISCQWAPWGISLIWPVLNQRSTGGAGNWEAIFVKIYNFKNGIYSFFKTENSRYSLKIILLYSSNLCFWMDHRNNQIYGFYALPDGKRSKRVCIQTSELAEMKSGPRLL